MAGVFHGKARRWQVHLTIASSGPQAGSHFAVLPVRSRMAAQLRWTTADGAVLDEHFKDPEAYDLGRERFHPMLVNPTVGEVRAGIDEAIRWLTQFAREPDWDGGAINVYFAGHGRRDDGALVMSDGVIDADTLIDALIESGAEHLGDQRRLRVSLMLDSCHSGAFLARFVCRAWALEPGVVYPFASLVACMHDEVAWEADHLEHGVLSYGIALADETEDTFTAQEASRPFLHISPLGLSSRLTHGKVVPFLTNGLQNPILFYETGSFQLTTGGGFQVEYPGDLPEDPAVVERALGEQRDERLGDTRALMRFLTPDASLANDMKRFVAAAGDLD